jgi:hypothetical protein
MEANEARKRAKPRLGMVLTGVDATDNSIQSILERLGPYFFEVRSLHFPGWDSEIRVVLGIPSF